MRCEECEIQSVGLAKGWRGYVAYDPADGEPPCIAIFCPDCAEREFGAPIRRSVRPPYDRD